MIIQGKAVFLCPMKKEEVTLHKDCVSCLFIKHYMWTGAHPVLCCGYKEEQQTGEKEHKEEEIEEEQGQRDWRDPQFIEEEE